MSGLDPLILDPLILDPSILDPSILDPSILVIVALFAAAVLAGYVDTLVGGGGLITIPALMFAGLSPLQALGTNKLQAIGGSGTASVTLIKRQEIVFDNVKWLMLLAFVGSMIGTVLVQTFDTSVLKLIIPAVLLFIAIYFIAVPNSAKLPQRAPTSVEQRLFKSVAVPVIGFYDGMFGPATGSFFAWAGVSLQGQSIVRATMVAKTLNFASNVASLLMFIWYGQVVWLLGAVMLVGQSIGATLGARALITANPNVLRYLVIAMCFTILFFWVLREAL